MKRKLGGSLAALLLATLGTVALVGYVQSAKDRPWPASGWSTCSSSPSTSPKGTTVADLGGLGRGRAGAGQGQGRQAVEALDELDQTSVAAVDLVPGEQVVATRFVTPVAAADGRAAGDQLTVTVPLEPERALGGQLRPGDTVAVFASFEPFDIAAPGSPTAAACPTPQSPNTTHLILHKVAGDRRPARRAVGGRSDRGRTTTRTRPTAPTTNLLVTLAVDAPLGRAGRLRRRARLVWLAAEPTTADEAGTKIVTRGNVYE